MSQLEVPNVYCETTLGLIVDDIKFDADHIAEIMRSRGVSEEGIAGHTFRLGAPPLLNDPEVLSLGTYVPVDKTVNLHDFARLYNLENEVADQVISRLIREETKERDISLEEYLTDDVRASWTDSKQEMTDRFLNHHYNDALIHEIDHVAEFETSSMDELIARRQEYRQKLYVSRQRKASALMLLTAAALVVPLAEAYEGSSPQLIAISSMAALTVAAASSFFGQRLAQRGLHGPLKHGEYLEAPWEVEARNFAEQEIGEYDASRDIDSYPLVIRGKPQPLQFV